MVLQTGAELERAVGEHIVQLCRELEAAQDVAEVRRWPAVALCYAVTEHPAEAAVLHSRICS